MKTNKKLELYFQKYNESLSFNEHYKEFYPVLQELKNKKSTEFFKSDIINLFSDQSREKYIKTIEPHKDKLHDLIEYNNKILSNINYDLEKFNHTKQYFCNRKNIDKIGEILKKSKEYYSDIQSHPEFDSAVYHFSKIFDNIKHSSIKILELVCLNHEKYILTTLSPYLVCSLGTILFLKIFAPLHAQNSFIIFMKSVINKCSYPIKIFSSLGYLKSGKNVYTFIVNHYSIISSIIVLFSGFINNFINNKKIMNTESTQVVSTIVNRYIDEAKNLEDPIIRYMSYILKKTGFAIGNIFNSMSQGIILGISSKNTDAIIDVAKKADSYIDKKR